MKIWMQVSLISLEYESLYGKFEDLERWWIFKESADEVIMNKVIDKVDQNWDKILKEEIKEMTSYYAKEITTLKT